MTHRTGRHHKLTQALREKICRCIAAGVSIEAACEQEGIGRATFYEWLRRGRTAIEDAQTLARTHSQPGDAPPPSCAAVLKLLAAEQMAFVALLASVEQALARAEVFYSRKIADASNNDWRAAAWWLERRRPDTYGNRETVRIERAPASMTNDELVAELQELGFVPTTGALVATTR